MSEIGIAVIGTGMWAKRLGSYLERVPSLRLVTCYSRTAEKREAFAAEFGGEVATSFEAAISHPDVQAEERLPLITRHSRWPLGKEGNCVRPEHRTSDSRPLLPGATSVPRQPV